MSKRVRVDLTLTPLSVATSGRTHWTGTPVAHIVSASLPFGANHRRGRGDELALGINDDGVVVGWYQALDGSLRGFRWRHPAAASTDLVPAGVAYDVSAHGHAVGTVLDVATGVWHGAD